MRQYIIRRLIIMVPVFLGVTVIIFALISSAPGDPFANFAEAGLTQADREARLRAIGYYDPLPLRYVKWLGQALRGNLGQSTNYLEPVTTVISGRIGNTMMLSLTSLVLGTVIAIPLGVISATRQYSAFDYAATIIALFGISIPAFFLALMLVWLFAIELEIFPVSGISNASAHYTGFRYVLDVLYHMALPLITLVFTHTASLMRYTRSAMLEVMQQDYIRTARAKGLSEGAVIYKHGLRNAMTTITTQITMQIGTLLSGAVLTETVFVWPGMGTLLYQAVGYRDYNLVVGCSAIIAICVLLANLLSDILYAVIDPRIRYS